MSGRTWVAAILVLALALAGCGADEREDGGGAEGGFKPRGPVNFVVHTGPGGGSDEFARALVELMKKEKLIEGNWPVRNVSGGSGALALGYMAGQQGRDGTIAAMTPTWLATPLSTEEVSVRVKDLTPIVQLATEPQVMAVRADSPYRSLEDVVDAARANPNQLVQSGGSPTATDALAAEVVKADAGVKWRFLSFEGGGERIAALLGGDADMMVSAASDFTEQVKAGKLRVIATLGTEASPQFPDAAPLAESGFDVEVPVQFRGIVGPPRLSREAVAYYEKVFTDLTRTAGWKRYVEEGGLVTAVEPSAEFATSLAEEEKSMRELLDKLGLLAEE